MKAGLNENTLELASLSWLEGLRYEVLRGQEIAPDEPGAEREDFGEVPLPDGGWDVIDAVLDAYSRPLLAHEMTVVILGANLNHPETDGNDVTPPRGHPRSPLNQGM